MHNFKADMNRLLIVLILSISGVPCYSQIIEPQVSIDTTIYSIADSLPIFSGGDSALAVYLNKNRNRLYTEISNSSPLITANVTCVITFDGKVTQVKVTELDKRFKRVGVDLAALFESSTDWTPGYLNGKPINTLMIYHIMIFYKIEDMPDKLIKNVTPKGKVISSGNIKLVNISAENSDKFWKDEYYNNGVKKTEIGDFNGALVDFSKALEIDSLDVDALFNRGVVKFKLKDREGACQDWVKIKSLGKPDSDELIFKYCKN